MTHSTGWTVHDDWITRSLTRLHAAVQPCISAILASVDTHACPMPPEDEAKVMRAIKEAAWR
jgi:hypothetical protein